MRTPIVLPALIVLSTLTACMHAQPQVAKEAKPSAASGYVGVVTHKATVSRFGFDLVAQGTQKQYVLPLTDGVSLIEVPPGQYRVVSWETAAVTGERLTRKEIPEAAPLGRPFEIKPGAVVMLGQWTVDRSGRTFIIEQARLDLQGSTSALVTKYPNFVGAPTSCPACRP